MEEKTLEQIYDDAYNSGVFIKEFAEENGYVAFAGRYSKLLAAGYKNTESLEEIDLIFASMLMSPGYSEESREKAIEEAIDTMTNMENL